MKIMVMMLMMMLLMMKLSNDEGPKQREGC